MKPAISPTEPLAVRRQKGQIYSHVRKKWLNETPEETVRQEYLCALVNEYGFALDQIDEEVSRMPTPATGTSRRCSRS